MEKSRHKGKTVSKRITGKIIRFKAFLLDEIIALTQKEHALLEMFYENGNWKDSKTCNTIRFQKAWRREDIVMYWLEVDSQKVTAIEKML